MIFDIFFIHVVLIKDVHVADFGENEHLIVWASPTSVWGFCVVLACTNSLSECTVTSLKILLVGPLHLISFVFFVILVGHSYFIWKTWFYIVVSHFSTDLCVSHIFIKSSFYGLRLWLLPALSQNMESCNKQSLMSIKLLTLTWSFT